MWGRIRRGHVEEEEEDRDLITLRKRYMPPPARNLSQLTGVSSVTFHIVDQAVSITSSQIPAWDKNSDSAKFFWAE